jgi:GNAT superfamily N-acetyltransferase
MSDRFPVTLPDVYEWESQVIQYADAARPSEPGTITYYAGDVSESYPGKPPIDCLLYWDRTASGKRLMIVGILNHYPVDYPPWEHAGSVNIWVRKSHQRRGIGTALAREAARRWRIDLDRQRFTASGAALAERLAELDS